MNCARSAHRSRRSRQGRIAGGVMIWRPMVKKAVVARSTAALQSSISRTRSALRRSHAPREAIIVIAGAPLRVRSQRQMIGVNKRAAHDYIETVTSGIDALTRSNRFISTANSRPLWQRVIAGERLPKRLARRPKCEGTVEDHRKIALDVRELIRNRVFERRVGSVFHLDLAYPWLRIMRLNSSSLDLELVTGRIVVVPLVSANCGVMGERIRLACPLCARRVCTLYYLEPRLACRRCNGLWYAAQRTSSSARKALAKRKIRRKLGNYGQLWAASTRQSRAACGGEPMRAIVRRWTGSSASSVIDRYLSTSLTASMPAVHRSRPGRRCRR